MKIWSGFQVPTGTTPSCTPKRFHGGSRRRSSSLLAVWFTAVEFSFCSLVLRILLFGGAGGMTDAGRVTDAVDPSASWFSVNSSCSF